MISAEQARELAATSEKAVGKLLEEISKAIEKAAEEGSYSLGYKEISEISSGSCPLMAKIIEELQKSGYRAYSDNVEVQTLFGSLKSGYTTEIQTVLKIFWSK